MFWIAVPASWPDSLWRRDGTARLLRPCRAAYQGERNLAVDEGYRGPDELCEWPVVADERRERKVTVIGMHDDVGGQEPRGGLDSYPVLAAIGYLPPEQVIRGGLQLQAKAEEGTLDEWDEDEQTTRQTLQRRADQLLGFCWRLVDRRGDDVGVVGARERTERANRLWNLALPVDGRGGRGCVATGSVGVLG
jgi:hypothetical protein